MLSDRGIREAVIDKRLVIDPFKPDIKPGSTPNLGTCSYNLTTDRLYELDSGVSFLDLPYRQREMEEFLEKYSAPYRGFMRTDRYYIGKSQELLRSPFSFVVTTRSSAARLGIQVHDAYSHRQKYCDVDSVKPRPVYFAIMAFAKVEVPEGSKISQIEFKPSFYLHGKDFLKEISKMPNGNELTLLSKTGWQEPSVYSRPDGIVLHNGHKIKVHNGQTLVWGQNNDQCFDEVKVTNPYYLYRGGFCLIPSLEYLHMPLNCAGWLWDINHVNKPFSISPEETRGAQFMIHPNAPLIAPGSEGNQIHEVWHNLYFWDSWNKKRADVRQEGLLIQAEKPISIMSLHPMDQTPENPYKGKYKGQVGPQTSLSQLD